LFQQNNYGTTSEQPRTTHAFSRITSSIPEALTAPIEEEEKQDILDKGMA
jgi:hypothetical protein